MTQKRKQKKTLRGLKEKKKGLLEEGTIRRFMKLAEIGPLSENFFDSKEELEEENEIEEEKLEEKGMYEDDLEADLAPAEGEVDLEADVEVEAEPEEEAAGDEVMLSDEDAQVLIDLADKLRAAGAGAEEAEVEDELGGEELPPPDDDLGGEEDAMALEGKDIEEEKDLEEKKELDEEKEDLEEEKDLEEKKSTDDLVSEIAKRVAARILLEK